MTTQTEGRAGGWLERQFGLKAHGTNPRTELVAGLTTFLTMVYIVFVNPQILGNAGMDKGAVFVATCLAAAVSTLVMALYANYPIALAPGMGLNAFFAFTVVLSYKYTWQQALAVVFMPAGPLLEYNPDKVKQVPTTPQELLAWSKANPNRLIYARPANSGPGRTFVMGLPYLLGDKDPKNPASWDKTWAYLKELNSCIEYYPTGTGAVPVPAADVVDAWAVARVSCACAVATCNVAAVSSTVASSWPFATV